MSIINRCLTNYRGIFWSTGNRFVRANDKRKNYISWKPEPDAVTVDAFIIGWR